MSVLEQIDEKEITLREAKSILVKLIADYDPDLPVFLTIDEHGLKKTFSLVPKRTRRRANGEAFSIREIPFEELETVTEPGTYLAIDKFNVAPDTVVPFIYGLYINYKNERDLRFFNDRKSCEKWLLKKIKLLEK